MPRKQGSTALKLLLVEEDGSDREVMLSAIRDVADVEMVLKADGGQALAYLGDFRPDQSHDLPAVIFLDLIMPTATGFDVLRELKRDAHARRIPTIVFTSSHREVDIYLSYQPGANAYVVKPDDPAKFWSVVRMSAEFWLHTNVRPPRGELV